MARRPCGGECYRVFPTQLQLAAHTCTVLSMRCSIDFNTEVTLDSIMASMFTTGFQATNIALAVDEINKMVRPPA